MEWNRIVRTVLRPGFTRDGSTPADMVLVNAEVFTSDDANPKAEAMAVKDGRLAYVGSDRGVARFVGPDTEVIDAKGRVVTPGFIDNHCHVLWIGGMLSVMTNRLFDAENLDELLQMVAEQAEANPEMPYVSGVGWRFEHLPQNTPDRAILDAVVKDRPVLLMSLCGQCGWYNTRAIELLQERNPQALERLAPARGPSGAFAGGLDHFHSFSPLDFFTAEEMAPVMEGAFP